MANQTITLKAQRINVFGPSLTQKWGAGTAWGSPTTWATKSAGAGGMPGVSKAIVHIIGASNTIYPLYANSREQQGDGRGYSYVFIDNVSNKESAAAATSFLSVSSYEGAGL